MRTIFRGVPRECSKYLPLAKKFLKKYKNQGRKVISLKGGNVQVEVHGRIGRIIIKAGGIFGYEFAFFISGDGPDASNDNYVIGRYTFSPDEDGGLNHKYHVAPTAKFLFDPEDPPSGNLIKQAAWYGQGKTLIGVDWYGTRYHDAGLYRHEPSVVGWYIFSAGFYGLEIKAKGGEKLAYTRFPASPAYVGPYQFAQVLDYTAPEINRFHFKIDGQVKVVDVNTGVFAGSTVKRNWYINQNGTKAVARHLLETQDATWRRDTQGLQQISIGVNTETLNPVVATDFIKTGYRTYGADYRYSDGALVVVKLVPYISQWRGNPATEKASATTSALQTVNAAVRDLLLQLEWWQLDAAGNEVTKIRTETMLHIPWIYSVSSAQPQQDEFGNQIKFCLEDSFWTKFNNAHGYQFLDGNIAALDLRADAYILYWFKSELGATKLNGGHLMRLKGFDYTEEKSTFSWTGMPTPNMAEFQLFNSSHPIWQEYLYTTKVGASGNAGFPLARVQRGLKFEINDFTAGIVMGQPKITDLLPDGDHWGGIWSHPDGAFAAYRRRGWMHYTSTVHKEPSDGTPWDTPYELTADVIYQAGEKTTHLEVLNESLGLAHTYQDQTYLHLAAVGTWVL